MNLLPVHCKSFGLCKESNSVVCLAVLGAGPDSRLQYTNRLGALIRAWTNPDSTCLISLNIFLWNLKHWCWFHDPPSTLEIECPSLLFMVENVLAVVWFWNWIIGRALGGNAIHVHRQNWSIVRSTSTRYQATHNVFACTGCTMYVWIFFFCNFVRPFIVTTQHNNI